MDLRFAIADLRALDALQVDVLALTFFEDERPLRGVSAAVDWRLASGLSRLLVREKIRGERGEQTLVSTVKRFPFERALLFGCGKTQRWKPQYAGELLGECLEALEHLHARSIALALPGRSMECVGVEEAWNILQAALTAHAPFSEVVVLEIPSAVRFMQDAARAALRAQHTLKELRNAIS